MQSHEMREPTSAAVWQQYLHKKGHALPPETATAKISTQDTEASAGQPSRAAAQGVEPGSQRRDIAAGKSSGAAAERASGKDHSVAVIQSRSSDVIDLVSSDEGGSAASSPSSCQPSQHPGSRQLSQDCKVEEKDEGKQYKPVSPGLLSALGLRNPSLATPQPQGLPPKPVPQDSGLVRGCRLSLLADFPQQKFPPLPYSNCELPKELRHTPKTADHRHDRLPRPGEKAPHVSSKHLPADKRKGALSSYSRNYLQGSIVFPSAVFKASSIASSLEDFKDISSSCCIYHITVTTAIKHLAS